MKQQQYIGVNVSNELYEMAGFNSQQSDYMAIR
jgi:hypothetical protein